MELQLNHIVLGSSHRQGIMSEINMPKAAKKISKIVTAEKDPVSVLQSRGLLNIDKTPIVDKCPTSEIDLTFYTEEAHLGELVKLFSSTHKFRNGKLVYSTVQEAAPQVSEEVDKFNNWWQSESSPAQIKDKGEINPSLDTQSQMKRKSLMVMMKDLEKEEIIKRYDSTSRKDREPQKNGALVKVDTYRSSSDENNYESNLRDQRIKRYFESQIARKEYQQMNKTEQKKNSYDSTSGKQAQINQNELGKKVYHAKWVHRSPKKSPSKSVRFTNEQELGKEESASIHRKSKKERFICKQPSQKWETISISSPSKKKIPGDPNKEHFSSSRPRIEQQHDEECEEEWIERLKGLQCRHPYTVHDKAQKKSFKKTPDKQKNLYRETFSNNLHETQVRSPNNKCPTPMGHAREASYGEGDRKLISCDSNTSICTVFYNCGSNYSSARMSSSASSIDNRELLTKFLSRKDRKERVKAAAVKHTLRKNAISCPDSDSFSLCMPPKKLNGAISERCNCCKQQSSQCPSNTILECYAQCHKRNNDDHHVMVRREVLKTEDSATIPEDYMQSMRILRKLVNPEALKEFRNKYGNILNEQSGDTSVTSYAKEHFTRQIREFRGN